jgi:hypothetical protein
LTFIIGRRVQPQVFVCRGCGCDDNHACEGGCSWVLLDIDQTTGVCSACAVELQWHPLLLAQVGLESSDAH